MSVAQKGLLGQGLVGKYFIAIQDEDGVVDEGWVIKELPGGLFYAETLIDIEGQPETVGRVVHPVEMKGWLFFHDIDTADRYWRQFVASREETGAAQLLPGLTNEERVDQVLDDLIEAKTNNELDRVKALEEILVDLTNSRNRQ